MKKTLAAVLAAAMALSTASVAFAKDTLEGYPVIDDDYSVISNGETVTMGSDIKRIIGAEVLSTADGDIDPFVLGKLVKDGDAIVTVTVTDGMANLAGKPTATVKNVLVAEEEVEVLKWQNLNTGAAGTDYDKVGKVHVGKKVVAEDGKVVKGIPVDENGNFRADSANAVEVLYPGDNDYTTALAQVKSHVVNGSYAFVTESRDTTTTSATKPAVQIQFKIADTWGTSSKDVTMKFRITFKKDKTVDGHDYKKGDTVMTAPFTYTGKYYEMDDVGTEMELTQPECSARRILMNKDSVLYDRIGSDEFTVYFENSASFTSKMAPNQKTLNLYYSVADIDDIVKQYPDIDFEFIDFKGQAANATTFVNTGTMSFNAIGGDETKVYEFVDGELNPLDGTFNKIADTIDVKGIKKLTTYVIAERELPEEEEPEEPEEPASSAPAIEDDNNGNPNTGAC